MTLRSRCDRARVQLRHARFVDANLFANLLHRRFAEVVEARRCGARAPAAAPAPRARGRALRVCSNSRSGDGGSLGTSTAGSVALSSVFEVRQRRRRFDRADADDRPLEARFVGAHALGEIGQRRLGAQLAAQLFARGLELAADAADAARPRVAAQRVDHRAAHAPLGKGLELDAAVLVEPVRRVDETEHAVLHEVAEVDRVRHRRRHAPGERFDERQTRDDSFLLMIRQRRALHCDPPDPGHARDHPLGQQRCQRSGRGAYRGSSARCHACKLLKQLNLREDAGRCEVACNAVRMRAQIVRILTRRTLIVIALTVSMGRGRRLWPGRRSRAARS